MLMMEPPSGIFEAVSCNGIVFDVGVSTEKLGNQAKHERLCNCNGIHIHIPYLDHPEHAPNIDVPTALENVVVALKDAALVHVAETFIHGQCLINSLLPLGRYINMDPYSTGLLISWT